MKITNRTSAFIYIIIIMLIILFSGCTEKSKNMAPGWHEIIPSDIYPDFTYNGLTPSCSAAPGTDASYSFFFRNAGSDKLLLLFRGGGACWHTNNCISYPSYSQSVGTFLNSSGEPILNGVFDTTEETNPFKNWNMLVLPYCTGDLHSGAADTFYETDSIRHRGFVNFKVAMKWLAEHTDRPTGIFVTGGSAGAYGAILNFPYIKDQYPDARTWVMGDAGNGVITPGFLTEAKSQWGIQFHDIFGETPEALSISDLYSLAAVEYTETLLAQYTSAWDNTQTTFYNMMLNIDNPAVWQNNDAVQCDWNVGATAYLEDITADNYRYYLAEGESHTILLKNIFYSQNSGGVLFSTWISAMVDSTVPIDATSNFQNAVCTGECGKPDELTCGP